MHKGMISIASIKQLFQFHVPEVTHKSRSKLFTRWLICFGIGFSSIGSAAAITCTGTETATTDSAARYDASAGTCTIGDNTTPLTGLDDITFVVSPDPVSGFDPPNDATEDAFFGTGGGANQTSHTGCTLGVTVVTAGNACQKPSFHVNTTFNNIVNRIDSSGNKVVMTVNTTTASFSGGIARSFSINTATVTIDLAPRITSIVRQTPATSPTDADSLTWRITFDQDVKNVDATDFSLSGSTATVTTVNTVSASVYDVTASGGDLASLNGTVTLSFAGGQNIADLADVLLANTTPTGTSDNTFVVSNDSSLPSVEILNAPATLFSQNAFNITVEFNEAVTGFVLGDITISNATAENFIAVDGNTYTADIRPNGVGNISIDIAAGVAQDAGSNLNTAAAQVNITCGTGCGQAATIINTQRSIQSFSNKRARNITAQGPGITGFLNGDGLGGGFNGLTGGPIGLNYAGQEGTQSGSFSTSLQQFQQFQHSLTHDAVGEKSMPNPLASPANIWIKGRWTHTEDDRGGLNQESDFGIIYVGADYRFSADTLIGLMGQIDWSNEKSKSTNLDADGEGWMLGPYIVRRLSDTLIMDLRLAGGLSDNEISPIGTYRDSYDSKRWQVEGNLTGSYDNGQWHISPALGINYFTETQEAYTDSNGFAISEQRTELGSLSFGPTLTYTIEGQKGLQVKPLIGIKGVWDFKAPDIFDVNGIAKGVEDELRAQLKLGLNILNQRGTTFIVSYTYDGIGVSDYVAHTGEVIVNMPLNMKGVSEGASLQMSYSLQDVYQLDSDEIQQGKLELNIPF